MLQSGLPKLISREHFYSGFATVQRWCSRRSGEQLIANLYANFSKTTFSTIQNTIQSFHSVCQPHHAFWSLLNLLDRFQNEVKRGKRLCYTRNVIVKIVQAIQIAYNITFFALYVFQFLTAKNACNTDSECVLVSSMSLSDDFTL